jgi:hypothetical protein
MNTNLNSPTHRIECYTFDIWLREVIYKEALSLWERNTDATHLVSKVEYITVQPHVLQLQYQMNVVINLQDVLSSQKKEFLVFSQAWI